MGFEFIVDHLMDLFLQECGLLFVECRLFVERVAEGVLGHLEVVFDHYKWILQSIL